jgi:hypothetical protein
MSSLFDFTTKGPYKRLLGDLSLIMIMGAEKAYMEVVRSNKRFSGRCSFSDTTHSARRDRRGGVDRARCGGDDALVRRIG